MRLYLANSALEVFIGDSYVIFHAEPEFLVSNEFSEKIAIIKIVEQPLGGTAQSGK